ncbi:MAG: acyl-CoA dehydratase activase, partial [Planctomycetota bacterium]
MSKYIGLDIGSISADFVVVDESQRIHETRYVRTFGRPMQVALEELQDLQDSHPGVEGLAVTGSGAELVGELLEVPFVNEIMAQSRGTSFLHPDVRTIIEIGGEDSKMIQLERGDDGEVRVGDFVMNAMCSAGTGSFLDQQASRLDVSIEEFSDLALKSDHPPRVAGRCSVFAKTDMIHLQQQGTPDYDIIAGLCFAMARNFKSNVAVGKEFIPPVAFQGGVAANEGMVRAFKEVLGMDDDEFIIPEYYGCTGALGTALHAMENDLDCDYHSLEPLAQHLEERDQSAERLPPLEGDGYEVDTSCVPIDESETPIDAYIGVDIGSISTNVVAINEDGEVIARRYLMTEGRPIEAVKKGLHNVGEKIGDKVNVKGCTTTGSGRYLIGEFVGADLIKNEISTHARGAVHFDEDVDTIFEIGGQDAKYISLENGAVVDFAMNKVCAAGTGSFLEEQAERLGLNIEEEFGETALSSEEPVLLGDRCTVFMESDINYHRQRGLPTDDLVSGLSYSIVYNYLNRVVEDRRVGDHIFFQGGVAFNRGVKAAFENVTGEKVEVPPHQDIMGAIGAALTAKEEVEGETNFRGFDLRHLGYELSTFECESCSNRCEIHKVSIEGQDPLFYGSRCGKYDSESSREDKGKGLPRLFQERREALESAYEKDEPDDPAGTKVAIPRIATFFDIYPLWKGFFTELGCEVELSTPTNKNTIAEGKEWITAETCLPIHVAHGHVAELLEGDSDYIFVPSVVNMEEEADRIVHSYVCPLVQSLPYTMRAAFDFEEAEPDLLDPTLHFEKGREAVNRRMKKMARELGFSASRAAKAMQAGWDALDRFREWQNERGREVLENLDEDRPALVIVSRSYNGCDAGMNLGIPDKLRDLGVQAIPLDMLPLDVEGIQDEFPHMYWKYGQKIIAGSKFIANDDRLNAVYITNFRCGPDAFISKFFDRVMGEKPFLTLEVDEHTADVGAITRCEAFLDSLENFRGSPEGAESTRASQDLFFDVSERAGDITVYIPYMDDHGVLMAATLRSNGIDAEALPMSDSKSLELGRQFTSGDECYPCILTTGDIVKKTREDDFDPEHSAFFMAQANGPCRFGQFHKFHRMVLDDLGY